jgi:hypothetical protein
MIHWTWDPIFYGLLDPGHDFQGDGDNGSRGRGTISAYIVGDRRVVSVELLAFISDGRALEAHVIRSIAADIGVVVVVVLDVDGVIIVASLFVLHEIDEIYDVIGVAVKAEEQC